MARPVVILFAKSPRLGLVKRRLASEIGDVAALRFYRNQLFRMIRELAKLKNFEVILALTPRHSRLQTRPGFRNITQNNSGLGQRMARCFDMFRRRQVILIGADIPDLSAAIIRSAVQKLKSHDAAFGPAADGGYYLVAMGAKRPTAPFANVRWSSPHALSDTLMNFQHHRITMLEKLHDVDTGHDFKTASISSLRRVPKYP
ncbi:MAG: TIGR04282 family arsenosugar biosynthesis glycosyltransferase [Acidocella sp.]|nr:TIGR04282 family arsenosugar biosynthesis glycosyltransferase [Acidocella sp.]